MNSMTYAVTKEKCSFLCFIFICKNQIGSNATNGIAAKFSSAYLKNSSAVFKGRGDLNHW
jgi:aspartyl aminopeptidase